MPTAIERAKLRAPRPPRMRFAAAVHDSESSSDDDTVRFSPVVMLELLKADSKVRQDVQQMSSAALTRQCARASATHVQTGRCADAAKLSGVAAGAPAPAAQTDEDFVARRAQLLEVRSRATQW